MLELIEHGLRRADSLSMGQKRQMRNPDLSQCAVLQPSKSSTNESTLMQQSGRYGPSRQTGYVTTGGVDPHGSPVVPSTPPVIAVDASGSPYYATGRC